MEKLVTQKARTTATDRKPAHPRPTPDAYAVVANEPIGYAKLTPLRAPAKKAAEGAVELEQLYVLPRWHGRGVADRLMKWTLQAAHAAGAPEIYLTVFDHNERAKRFYYRHGFREVGSCTFQLGSRIDDDRIWRRELGLSLLPQHAATQ